MYRKVLTELMEWRISSRRKPLVLKGARQVGKTWLMKELAEVQEPRTHLSIWVIQIYMTSEVFLTGLMKL